MPSVTDHQEDFRWASGHSAPVPEAQPAARRVPSAAVAPRRAVGRLLLAYVVLSPGLARTNVVICPFRRLTGKACPLCGLTRSLSALLSGDLRRSVAAHPLGWAVIPAALDLWLRPAGPPFAPIRRGGAR